jgi:hypothetical protein
MFGGSLIKRIARTHEEIYLLNIEVKKCVWQKLAEDLDFISTRFEKEAKENQYLFRSLSITT